MAQQTSPPVRVVHVRIEGRVQGVYYRMWAQENARRLGLDGWARNRRDGSVEAVFAGAGDRVEEMLRRCARGPRAARVTSVQVIQDGGAAPAPGFSIEPDA
ncbi:MAG: acylphosphatase [Hyphomicrobiales bacterium]|nr:acylphosphatase [Hyphomicrobiales bacterium]